MANFLKYDVYDLELTAVRVNTELRKFLIDTSKRIIVFTTNYGEKLDPALIWRGRMDKHIELSYCCFEAFIVLAKNYLDLESHKLFARIENLLEETKMTPADVAENLMPKSAEEDREACLVRLINNLEEAKAKAEEEAEAKG
ncbi:P-loop containing nucleoside triphosphate hydrolase superfamily protein [Forsythia ovata]|uniref:P-loop containing nucleoside triphosphate hydrolase superfamily protein n=1 Tax=Forsythia ovata TaxID=205694 RepID=A0ABD1UUH4_9LAMI